MKDQITRQNRQPLSGRLAGGGKCRTALFPLMLLMLLLAPTRLLAQEPYAVLVQEKGETWLKFYYDNNKPDGAFSLNNDGEDPAWIGHAQDIQKVLFDTSFTNARPMSCYSWFKDCKNLTYFYGKDRLNTEEVTNMEKMFSGCSSLRESISFKTGKVTNMNEMFSGCSGLTELDLSSFDTGNVTNMASMFSGCSGLTELDLSKFNTGNVTDMNNMFYYCSGLPSLDLSSFDTGNVTNMGMMFSECFGLPSLDLSSFDTRNVTDMQRMFYNCFKLPSLDLSSFDTGSVTKMREMISHCSGLQAIYVRDEFVITDGCEGDRMFSACDKLQGASVYDANSMDQSKANYRDGYFTRLVLRNGDERYGIAGETTEPLIVDRLALEDGKDFEALEPFQATEATYSRTMKANTTWGTLCLPFEVSLDNRNFRAFELHAVDNGANAVELQELEGSIPAGTPVLVKMNAGESALALSTGDVKVTAYTPGVDETEDGSFQLVGLYAKKMFTQDDNGCYILKSNQLMSPAKILEGTQTTAVGSKPFRAYMEAVGSQEQGAQAYAISEKGGEATGIGQLMDTLNGDAAYFDLQGHRLNGPQKGVNIVRVGSKTMKIIIK